jgi:hypothetical protein
MGRMKPPSRKPLKEAENDKEQKKACNSDANQDCRLLEIFSLFASRKAFCRERIWIYQQFKMVQKASFK